MTEKTASWMVRTMSYARPLRKGWRAHQLPVTDVGWRGPFAVDDQPHDPMPPPPVGTFELEHVGR